MSEQNQKIVKEVLIKLEGLKIADAREILNHVDLYLKIIIGSTPVQISQEVLQPNPEP